MNRIFTFTLFIAFSMFSIISCDRSSDDNKPQEQPRIIEVPFTEELKGVYQVQYKNTSSGWEAVPANKYKLEFRQGNTVYWTDENGEHEEFFADPENRYPYAGSNNKKYLFYVWDKKPLKDGEYYEIVMIIRAPGKIINVFHYYCTKQR